MYTADNDGKFWVEPNVWATGTPQGGWMPYLSKLYGGVDEFRVCPSAAKINGVAGGIGTTFRQWGPGEIMELHQFGEDASKNYGSYGTNLWINSLGPASPSGWRGQPERQWQRLQSKYVTEIPMIGDCVWFGSHPTSLHDQSGGGYGGAVPPSEDFFEKMDPENPDWRYFMGRFCINRHSRSINMGFMDGSTRKVILSELWSLKWHKEYKIVYDVQIPWLR